MGHVLLPRQAKIIFLHLDVGISKDRKRSGVKGAVLRFLLLFTLPEMAPRSGILTSAVCGIILAAAIIPLDGKF